MKTLTITLNPREWIHNLGLAARNTALGVLDTFRNPRLIIGIAASVLLHASLLLVLFINRAGKTVDEDIGGWEIVSVIDGNENPKVTKLLNDQTGSPFGKPDEVVNKPLLTPVNPEFQALINIPKDATATDMEKALTGDLLYINPSRQKSIEQILASEPVITIRKGEAVPNNLPFRILPDNPDIKDLTANNPITKSNPVIKNDPTHNTNVNNITTTKGSSYTLEGDLSFSDIVSSFMPAYPQFARAKGLSNVQITIDFTVNSQGKVSPAMIVTRSTGYPEWDSQVKETLSRWVFKNSEIARRSGRITFRFVLT